MHSRSFLEKCLVVTCVSLMLCHKGAKTQDDEDNIGPPDGPVVHQNHDTTQNDDTTNDVTPDDVTPNDATPNDETPNDATPNDETTNDATPNDETTNDTTPNDADPINDETHDDKPNTDEIAGFNLDDQEIENFKLWPGGEIPYYIDTLSYDKVLRDRIRDYLSKTKTMTGLNFQELPRVPNPEGDSKERWVFFLNRRSALDCQKYTNKNFTNEGKQVVTIGYDCLSSPGQLAGLVLAIAGVPPQHNAPDRDEYITVETANLEPGKETHFEKLQDAEWLFHDIKYDYESAGHFGNLDFSANGKATIRLINNSRILIGESKDFSPSDIKKIKLLYNYIKRKYMMKKRIPECKKMFQPGEGIKSYNPKTKCLGKPSKKPSKYSSVPDHSDDEGCSEGKGGTSDNKDTEDKGSTEEEKPNDIAEDKNAKASIEGKNAKAVFKDRNAKAVFKNSNAKAVFKNSNAKAVFKDRNAKSSIEERNAKASVEERNAKASIEERNAKASIEERNAKASTEERNANAVFKTGAE